MDFSQALQAIKSGHKLTREGWNGKGMWIALASGTAFPPGQYQVMGEYRFPTVGYIIMKTAAMEMVPWIASQTDLLANDWELV